MKYLSVCSGIEAATTAWHSLGWDPVAFSEIEPFPSAVLAHHWPAVPNLGDMTKYKEWNLGKSIGLLVGGTPCQSFSVAGLRKGLTDPRGNLMLTYGAIADHFKPTWIVWENVPGVLSSNGGRDFGTFLGMLAELGYGFAYRVLDAQYFGVAQRRRRVFVVGYLGDWRPAAQVLFESESLRWDPAPSRETREGIAGTSAICFEPRSPDGHPRIVDGGVAPTLNRMGGGQREPCVLMDQGGGVMTVEHGITGTLRAQTHGHEPVVMTEGISKCLTKGSAQRLDTDTETFVTHGAKVRKLTPVECERLQGFPDNHTQIPWRGRPADACPDGPRYKACGNSMAVPVMRWIGGRINTLDITGKTH